MASKAPLEATPLRTLQRYHHSVLNCFGDGETLVDAVQRRPGFYGPNPIAYLSLMARRTSLALGDLEEALINDRALVRAGAFRASMFLLAAEDYPIYFRAFAELLAESGMGRLRASGIDEGMLATYARRLRESAFTMSKSSSELLDIILPIREKRPDADVERVLMRKLCDLGVLIRTTSKGWKGNQYNFALADLWFEEVELTSENPEPARVEVIRRYLRAYGPARVDDIVWWTGLSLSDVRRAIDQLGREAVPFPVDGLGDGLLALRETVDSIRKAQLEQNRILFLPLWDTYPFGWRDRARVVDATYAPWVYDNAGNASSVILEEGRVIGLWQFRDGDSITLEFHLFEPYANRLNAVRLAADDHAALLATVAGARDVRVIERALPPALAERPTASFLWPLGKEPVFRVADSFSIANPMDRRGPNVLRSKFLDDERLVRPTDTDVGARAMSEPDRGGATTVTTAPQKSAAKPTADARAGAESVAAAAARVDQKQAQKTAAKAAPQQADSPPQAKAPAAKKPPKAMAKKTPAKAAAKKAPAKNSTTQKPAAKTPAAKKPAAKKSPAKKPAAKKPAAKKPAAKKPAAKKPAANKSLAKKPATKKKGR